MNVLMTFITNVLDMFDMVTNFLIALLIFADRHAAVYALTLCSVVFCGYKCIRWQSPSKCFHSVP